MIKLYDVLIVGGGPVGLFLGLVLARGGTRVMVIEAEPEINQSPRALMHFPIVLNEFKKAGILDEVVAAGFKNTEGLCFRTPYFGTNAVLAKIPPGKSSKGSIGFGVQLGQAELCAILRKHALEHSNFSIQYSTPFISFNEDGDSVHVVAINSSTNAPEHFAAKFLIACDGANSTVRKATGIPFEGFTWKDWRFVAINIHYDFATHGYPAANHVIDPEDWAVIVRASNVDEGLWRIAMGVPPELQLEDLEQYVVEKVERLMPGPRPLEYKIDAISPYWAHEKVASTYRAGRVVLCGDAAHLNNPLTALGLTTGLVDAVVLARVLPVALVADSKKTGRWPGLLDRYASMRRKDFVKRVQKQAIAGKLRMHSTERKVVAERDDFFNMLNKSPGFGMFIASIMMEPLVEELWPSPVMALVSSVKALSRCLQIIAMIIFWKIQVAFS